MGMRYMIDAFNYPWGESPVVSRQTNYFIVAAIWFAYYSIQYDGVNLTKRK